MPALSRLVEVIVERETGASMGGSLDKVIEREPVEDLPAEAPAAAPAAAQGGSLRTHLAPAAPSGRRGGVCPPPG